MDTKTSESVVVAVPSKELTAALRRVMDVTKQNPLTSAYAHVLIDAFADGEVLVTAGSDYQRLTVVIKGANFEGEQISVTLVPELKSLLDSVATIPQGLVWLSEAGAGVTVKSSVSDVLIPAIPKRDYPDIGLDNFIHSLSLTSLQAVTLANALRRCGKFMGKDDVLKRQLAGVWIKPVNGKMTLEATDAYLSTIMYLDIGMPSDIGPVLIPHYSVDGLASSLGEEATIKFSPSWLSVDTSTSTFYCRVMDEKPLNMAALFPLLNQLDASWNESKAILVGILKRIVALPGTPVKTPGGTTSTFHVARLTSTGINYGSLMGEYKIDQPIEGWDGPDLAWRCGVHCQKMLTFLGSLPGDDVSIHLDSTGTRKMMYVEDTTHRTLLMANFM